MLKRIFVVLAAVVVVLAIVGVLLPRNIHVERSISIARPASLIFATVDSFQLFPKWSPWQDLDPNMHQSTEGPRDGVGAKLVWSGNDKVGSGTQVITAATANQSVSSDVDFGKMGVAKSTLVLQPQGDSTRVTWGLDIDMGANPVGHYFGLMMDRMIGKDYAKGLSKLKTLAESMPNVDIDGFAAEPVDMTAAPVLVLEETSAHDPASISRAYADAFTRVSNFIAKNKLKMSGAPLGIDGAASASAFTFQAGIPVDRADVTPADNIKLIQSYAGKALKTTHIGPYETLAKTYDAMRAYMAAHGYQPAGSIISWYLDDPGLTPAARLRTELYQPI
jgi:effector-binding domain-containing protein